MVDCNQYYIDMSESNAYDIIEYKNKNCDIAVEDTCDVNDNIEGFTNMGQGYLNKCCPTGSVLNNNNECVKFCNNCPNITYNHYTYDVIEDIDDNVVMYTDCSNDASPYYNYNSLNNLNNQFNLLNQYDLSQNPTNASLIKDSLSKWTDAFMDLINPDEGQLDMSDLDNVLDDLDGDDDGDTYINDTPTDDPPPPNEYYQAAIAAADLKNIGYITDPQSNPPPQQPQTSSQPQTMNNTNNLLYLLALLEINPKLKTDPDTIRFLQSLKPS